MDLGYGQFDFNITLAITKVPVGLFWAVLLVALLGTIGLSAALVYHWNAYGLHMHRVRIAKISYFVVLISLFCFSGLSLLLYTLSS